MPAKLSAEERKQIEKENAERFIRVAGGRVNKALSALSGLQNCSNPRSYKYSEDQVAKMFSAIDKHVAAAKKAFAEPAAPEEESGFTF